MASHLSQRLLIVTGKGGVGKSAVAAALALGCARRGLRTLVCEVNTQERVSQLLGHPPVGPDVAMLEENLWAVDIRPAEAMREYALMILKFESIYNAVFENRLVRYFLRFIPSVQELVILGKILFHYREKRPDDAWRFDRIVVDAPATGHAIAFLGVPKVLLETVPPGAMEREARIMRDILVDPAQTGAVLVTLPEEMPVNEAIELHATLRDRLELRTAAVLLNGFIETRFSAGDLERLLAQPGLAAVAQAHESRARLAAEHRARLESKLSRSAFTLPRLYHPEFGRSSVEELTARLGALLEEAR